MVALDLKIDLKVDPSIGGGVDFFYNIAGLEFKKWPSASLSDTSFRRAQDVLFWE